MDDEQYDKPPKPKRPKTNIAPQSGPSASRMAACDYYLWSNKSQQSKTDTDKSEIIPTLPTSNPQKVLMDNTETEPAVAPKGKLVITTHGIAAKIPRVQKFKCMDCDVVESSHKLFNTHFKASHDKLFCEECGQTFYVPSTLERHMYMHTKKEQFPCIQCDTVFPFASNLQIHMFKHTTVAGYQCDHGSCKKMVQTKR